MEKIVEAISLEADLLIKLKPLSEAEIFDFMKNLRGGTYFNMGMYSSIPVSRAYKSTIRIYKVIDLTAIVSGVDYENIGTTKDFRDATGTAPGKSWYDHTPGYEHKVGQKKSDPNSKYVLWDIKRGTGTCVRYYVVDIETGAVTPVSKEEILESEYLTNTEKAKLTPKPVVGIDLTTGQAVENKTNWRTAAFEHIFWLSQAGKATREYGTRFEEDFGLTEAFGDDLFIDAHANVKTKLDDILSGSVVEERNLKEYVNKPEHNQAIEQACKIIGCKFGELEYKSSDKEFANNPTYTKQANSNDIAGYENKVRNMKTSEELNSSASNSKYYRDYDLGIGVIAHFDYSDSGKSKIVLIPTSKMVESKNLQESYRCFVSRGASLVDNELFVDFD